MVVVGTAVVVVVGTVGSTGTVGMGSGAITTTVAITVEAARPSPCC
jgi:hypothetical protein